MIKIILSDKIAQSNKLYLCNYKLYKLRYEIFNIGKYKANIVTKNKLKTVRSAYNEELLR